MENTPKVRNVKDTNGIAEYGIDIVFSYPDAFGKIKKYGIQVKSGDITSSVVEITLGQLSIAFGHVFPDEPPEYLNGAYVITDGRILNQASEYFHNAKIGFREIFLIGGNEILPFLEKYERKMDIEIG